MPPKTNFTHVCAPEKHGKDMMCPACTQAGYYRHLTRMKDKGLPGEAYERLVWLSCMSEEETEKVIGELRFRWGPLATAMAFNVKEIDVVWELDRLRSLTTRKHPSAVRMKALEMIDRLRKEALQAGERFTSAGPLPEPETIGERVAAEAGEPDDWGKTDE